MKKKLHIGIFVLTGLIVVSLVVGVTLAYLFAASDSVIDRFEKAVVACTVSEVFDGTQKTEIKVTNTGNTTAYLRVRLSTHWENSSGNIIAKPSANLKPDLAAGWFSSGNNDNTYYYNLPVEPNHTAPNLLASPLVLVSEGDTVQVIEVFAEAIQSKPPEAIGEAWHISVGSDGKLISPAPPTP